MSDLTSNTYTSAFFIVPSYILDLPGMTLGYLRVYEAIFQFWNHNKTCFLSEEALCARSGLKRSQVYAALAYLEDRNEIKRVQKKHKRYIVRPEKIIETDCIDIKPVSALPDVSTKIILTSAPPDLDVRSTGRDPSAPPDYNNKKLNKEIKELTNCKSSSSFFFSETTDRSLLNQKLPRDERTPEEFLKECVDHVDNCSDKKFPRLQRANALVKLLNNLKESNVVFRELSTESSPQKIAIQETDKEKHQRWLKEREEQRKKMYG